jgi:hypothetical protein
VTRLPGMDAELQAIADEAMADMRAGRLGPQEVEVWWERRRENEPTTNYLGRVLEEAADRAGPGEGDRLLEVAKKARAAHYDDYFAPTEVADGFETLRLVRDLRRAGGDLAKSIEEAVRAGEFDGTKAESDRWARGEAGQAAFRELTKDIVPKAGRNDPCPCGSGRKYKRCHGQ